MLERFGPPGYLTDFDAIPGQLDQWSAAVSGWFDGNIEIVVESLAPGDQPQFYNPTRTDPPGTAFDQVIAWNGFPATLRNRWGRAMALRLADRPVPLTARQDGPGSYFVGPQWEDLFYRPQDEYCEWHVFRDDEGRIVRITFTSEPPEYWQALHGDTLPDVDNNPKFQFTGDKELLVDLYREYVSPEVTLADLECAEDLVDYTDPRNPAVVYPKGSYNPYNRWNTTGGAMHLNHPANSLSAEINLGAVATILRQSQGRPVVDPDALISCAAYGGLSRTSDPTIGSSVNELAFLGAHITLPDPVGLAMHHIDLAGFTTPTGEPVDPSWFRVVRGEASAGFIERAVFEVPAEEGFLVSDLRIGGVPITSGGQVAEHIVVNIVGRAVGLGAFQNTPVPCKRGSCQDNLQPNFLLYHLLDAPCGPTARAAFAYPGPTPAAPVTTDVAVEEVAPRPEPAAHHRRTRTA